MPRLLPVPCGLFSRADERDDPRTLIPPWQTMVESPSGWELSLLTLTCLSILVADVVGRELAN